MKKTISFITIIIMLVVFNTNAQIKIITDGKVGVGTATTPTSQLELGDNQWLKINARTTKGGVLFYETGTNGAADIQYGARLFYDQTTDRMNLVTKQNNADVYGITIQRTYGKVGIWMNGTPTFPLDVNGSVRASSFVTSSDIRLKSDVKIFDKSSAIKLFDLEAITYKPILREKVSTDTVGKLDPLDSLNVMAAIKKETEKTMIGFSAQEVKKVFPELVCEDDKGFLSLDYIGLIPVLVEALKAQNVKIEELEKKVAALSTTKPK